MLIVGFERTPPPPQEPCVRMPPPLGNHVRVPDTVPQEPCEQTLPHREPCERTLPLSEEREWTPPPREERERTLPPREERERTLPHLGRNGIMDLKGSARPPQMMTMRQDSSVADWRAIPTKSPALSSMLRSPCQISRNFPAGPMFASCILSRRGKGAHGRNEFWVQMQVRLLIRNKKANKAKKKTGKRNGIPKRH